MANFTALPPEVLEFIAFLSVVPDVGETGACGRPSWRNDGATPKGAASEQAQSERERATILRNLRSAWPCRPAEP
jgi:hypothetical protein